MLEVRVGTKGGGDRIKEDRGESQEKEGFVSVREGKGDGVTSRIFSLVTPVPLFDNFHVLHPPVVSSNNDRRLTKSKNKSPQGEAHHQSDDLQESENEIVDSESYTDELLNPNQKSTP